MQQLFRATDPAVLVWMLKPVNIIKSVCWIVEPQEMQSVVTITNKRLL